MKGGKARAHALSSERRGEIARLAVAARWGKMTDTIKANEFIEHLIQKFGHDLAEYLKGDVLFINSPIFMGLDKSVRQNIESIIRNKKDRKRGKEPKLIVILETTGGYIEVVERICYVFRKHYREVDYIIPDHAYSAGTVLALSGDKIYMDYYSVFGPIDPQVQNSDEKFIPGMGYL